MDELKTVATFADPMLASITQGLLKSNGIEAEIGTGFVDRCL